VGERFWRDYSKLNKFKLSGLKRVHDGAAAGMLVVVVLLPLSLPMYDSEFDHGGCGGGCGGPAAAAMAAAAAVEAVEDNLRRKRPATSALMVA
jgi:hypothetical protein